MTVLLLDLDGVLLHPAPGLDDALPGAAPAGCLLADDSAANVEGARTAGVAALLRSSAAELRPELVRRGLLDG